MEDMTVNESQGTITVPLAYFEKLIERVAEQTAKKTSKKLCDDLYSKEAQRRDFDKRLYNVRLLLKNYRSLREHAMLKASEIVNIDDEQISAIEILDSFQNLKSMGANELKLESIISSTMRTKVLINYMDDMIALYKQTRYNSGKQEDLRRADVLDALFLKPCPPEIYVTDIVSSLAQKWSVSERQIWRDTNYAIEQLTALLFGVDGVNLLEDKKRRRLARLAEEKNIEKQ
jgi:hypothetical protein